MNSYKEFQKMISHLDDKTLLSMMATLLQEMMKRTMNNDKPNH